MRYLCRLAIATPILCAIVSVAQASPSLSFTNTSGGAASVRIFPGSAFSVNVTLNSDTVAFDGLSYYLKASAANDFTVASRVTGSELGTWDSTPNGLTDPITNPLPSPMSGGHSTLLDTTANSVDFGYDATTLTPNIAAGSYLVDQLNFTTPSNITLGQYTVFSSLDSLIITAQGTSPNLIFQTTSFPASAVFTVDVISNISTWNGGGSTINWSSSSNWDTAPIDGSNLVFAGTTRLSDTNDSLSSAASITFASGAGAFTLSGSALSISGGVTNNSTNPQTISLNLSLSAPQQFNAASGNLSVGGAVNLGSNTLTITGSANTAIGGAISGAGAIAKSGSGTATLSGNSSYTGGTTVNGGTLIVSHVHGLGQSTTNGLTINNTALVKITTGTGAGPVVLPSLSINGGASPVATLDLTNSKMVLTNTSYASAVSAYTVSRRKSPMPWMALPGICPASPAPRWPTTLITWGCPPAWR